MSCSHVLEFRDDNFDSQVTKHKDLVLVDFWASWCAPCKAIAPHVEALAHEFDGQVKVGKLNVDDHPNTAGTLGIRALPTILLFKNGQVVEQIVGAVSKDRLTDMIKNHI